jgi:hypothetical protein
MEDPEAASEVACEAAEDSTTASTTDAEGTETGGDITIFVFDFLP